MLSADPPICSSSKSPCSFDMTLLKKPDGILRFAIDEFNLLNPQSTFDLLSSFFSKLDIAAAYWSIHIHPADRGKTAFHTPRGLYEINVMPSGKWLSSYADIRGAVEGADIIQDVQSPLLNSYSECFKILFISYLYNN